MSILIWVIETNTFTLICQKGLHFGGKAVPRPKTLWKCEHGLYETPKAKFKNRLTSGNFFKILSDKRGKKITVHCVRSRSVVWQLPSTRYAPECRQNWVLEKLNWVLESQSWFFALLDLSFYHFITEFHQNNWNIQTWVNIIENIYW